ncbi:trypsin-like serine peptidase [Chromobacterium vaccinii]|uniref:trypsin-like serine peptidase n=1 Tax=Chromobacterium vaccinii TaxID=1108595 RepID=UPI003C74F80F
MNANAFAGLLGAGCLTMAGFANAQMQVSEALDASQALAAWPASEMAKLFHEALSHAMAGSNPNILTSSADINGYAHVPHPYAQAIESKASGRLFFREPSGKRSSCSATVVRAPQHDMLVTAGHCVWSGSPRRWNKDFVFVPAYDGSAVSPAPLGVWPGIRIAALDDGSLPGLDLAAIKVNGGIEEKTGGMALALKERPLEGAFNGYLVGYPNFGYDGKSMLRCLGKWAVQPIVNGQFVSSNCGPKGGNSGGGILVQENGNWQAKILGVVTDGSGSDGVLNAGGVPLSTGDWNTLVSTLHR